MEEKMQEENDFLRSKFLYDNKFRYPAAITFCGITGFAGYISAQRQYDMSAYSSVNLSLRERLGRSFAPFARGVLKSALFAAPVSYLVGRSFVLDSEKVDADIKYKDYPIMTRSILGSIETGLRWASIGGVPVAAICGVTFDGFASSGANLRPGPFLGYAVATWAGICAMSIPVSTAVGAVVGWQRERAEQSDEK